MDLLGSEGYWGREQSPGSRQPRRRLQRESDIVQSKMASTSEDVLENGGNTSTLALLPRRCPSPEMEEEGALVIKNAEDRGSDSGIENEPGERAPLVHGSPSARDAGSPQRKPKERLRTMAFQILPPFVMAGLGCVFAGMLLDRVEVCGVCVRVCVHMPCKCHTQ